MARAMRPARTARDATRLGGTRRVRLLGRLNLRGDRADSDDGFAPRTQVDDDRGLVEGHLVALPEGLLHLDQVLAVVMEDCQLRSNVPVGHDPNCWSPRKSVT